MAYDNRAGNTTFVNKIKRFLIENPSHKGISKRIVEHKEAQDGSFRFTGFFIEVS
ncbi:MAG: hypothetical protein PWP49_1822 [Thermococcaceae archaeon]|jgi:hypothetical protein|nr:hypothetical protein [Thermococcaceae archaeon]MDN5321402.1 hypothetical protein [Thermococcaceae archaeon]